MSDAPSVAMKDRDGAASPELLDEPGIQYQRGDQAGRGGSQRGCRNVLVKQRLPGIGGVRTDGEELAVREVRDPADRVLERERHRR